MNELLHNEFGNYKIEYYEEQNKEYAGMVIKTSSKIKVRSRLAKKHPKKQVIL
jgi:hypothetical protein